MKLICSALKLFCAASLYGQSVPALQTVRNPEFDSLAAPLADSATPGLGLVVVHRGVVVHAATYGVEKLGGGKLDFDSQIYVASLGKMFTAFGVLQLVDAGKLSLETTVAEALPNAPAYMRHVTVKQLLTHTSGLIDHVSVGGDDRAYSIDDVMRMLATADSLRFTPGARSGYSNSAYVLLARIIERISSQSYEHYVLERFFRPAGMKSVVVASPRDILAHRVLGYSLKDGKFVLDDYTAVANSATGDGDVYASLEDLYRWGMALRAGRFLKPETLKAASTETKRNDGRPTEWGMGWLAEFHGKRDPLAGKWYVAAFGSLGGFRALFKWYQQDDLLMIWVANSDSNTVMDRLEAIPRIVLLK